MRMKIKYDQDIIEASFKSIQFDKHVSICKEHALFQYLDSTCDKYQCYAFDKWK